MEEDCVAPDFVVENLICDTVGHGSVAVVLNGPMDKDYGTEIDQHDCIFRFNNFRTYGYEKEVGSRTTWWVVNGDANVGKTHQMPALCPFPEKLYTEAKVREFKKLNRIFYTLGDFTRCVPKGHPFPSTGYVFLLLLDFLLEQPFNVYGFNKLQGGHYFKSTHPHSHKHNGILEHKNITENYPKITIK